MSEHPDQRRGLTWTDTGAALACALIVSLMYCLNQDFPTGLLQTLFLAMFVVPPPSSSPLLSRSPSCIWC